MLITVLMRNFSKYLVLINFWGKFYPKICCFPYLMQFSIEIQQTYIYQNKLEETSQSCENVLVNKHIFYRFYHFSFAHKLVLKFCIYVYVHVFVFGAASELPVVCTINCSIQFSKNSMCLFRT